MTHPNHSSGLQGGSLRVPLAGLLLWLATTAAGAEDTIALLETRTANYTNATITSKTRTHLFLVHLGGVASVKAQDLDPDLQQRLGFAVAPAKADKTNAAHSAAAQVTARLADTVRAGASQLDPNANLAALVGTVRPSSTLIFAVLGGALLLHLFFSYCCLLICRKAGGSPGLLIWLPLLQLVPLLRAAGMSGWWFLAFFIPVLNLVAQILWCFNIVKARGKSLWVAVFLVLPFTSVFAFLHLAFSGAGSSDDRTRAMAPPSEAAWAGTLG